MTNQNITEEIKAVLGTGYENAESFSQEQSYLNAIQQFGIENISIENKGSVTNDTYVVTLRSNWNEAELWSEIDQAYVDASFSYNSETGFNVTTVFKFSNDISEVQFNASTGEYQLVSKANQKVISAGAILDQDGNVSTSFKIGDLLSFTGTTGLNNENIKLSGKIDLNKIAGELNFAQNEDGSSSAGLLGVIDNNTDLDGIGFKIEKVATNIDVIGLAAEYFDALPGQIPSNFATWTYDTFTALSSDPTLSDMVSGQYAITMQEYRTAIESGMEDFGWSMARAHQEVIEGWDDFLAEQPNLAPSVTSADYINDSIVLRPAPVGAQLNTYTEPTGTSLLEVIQGGIVDENGNEIPASSGTKILMPDENGNLVEQVLVSSETLEAVAEDLGISSADLINRAANNYIAGKQTAVDAGNGFYMYTFYDGEQWDITPADNDATYSLKINLDADNPSYVAPNAYTSLMDLDIDISGSSQTAGVALSEVPLKPEYLPEKATVIDGANEQTFYGFALDEEDAIGELKGGAHYSSGAVIREGGGSFSYVPEGETTSIDGNTYLISDVLQSITSAGETVTTFINNQVGNYLQNTFDTYNIFDSMTNFFEKYGLDIANGNLDADDALKYFTIEVAIGGLGQTVAEGILSTEMNTLNNLLQDPNATQQQINDALQNITDNDDFVGVLQELGLADDLSESIQLANQMASVFGAMAAQFALDSSGWDSTDYVNSGSSIILGAVVQNFVASNWETSLGASGSLGVASALSVLGTSLINDGFDQDWGATATSVGMAFGTAYATASIGTAIAASGGLGFASSSALAGAVGASLGFGGGSTVATSAIIAGGAALAGIGIVVALAANEIFSSIYSGKKFYAGEFGDKGQLLNSIYQVQDIEVDDGMGGTTTVEALVATNSSGSTILMQSNGSQFDYVIGGSGADILVGDNTGDIMSGGDGNDYIEGKEGDEQISGDAGNDHLIGAEGDDVIQGGDGDDIIFGDAGEDTILGGDGQDFIHGGSGADAILGGLERDTILASGGDDVVQGDAGDDMIDGGYGDDLLDGGDGDDLILGNLGNDSITAGAGNDKLFGDSGNDTMMGDAGDDYINGGEGIDILQGGNGADLIYGDSGDDYLQGDLGDDDLGGGTGNDVILGGLDNDYLWGQEGDDDLDGGEGDDILIGGLGTDTLTGAAGSDVYVLQADDSGVLGNDTITDVEGVNDRVYIEGLDSTNESNLGLTKDGDNLLISFNAVTIATIAGHFATGADSIERIEFDTDKFIDLSAVTYDGGTGVGTFTSSTDANQTTKADIDLRETDIDVNLQVQEQFWNNAFLRNLSETAYEEALRDEFETEYYNGSEITEFKRSRGKFGGHYKVYRLQQSDTLDPSNPDIISYTLLDGIYTSTTASSFDPTEYDEIVDGEVGSMDAQVWTYFGLRSTYNNFEIKDFFIDNQFVGGVLVDDSQGSNHGTEEYYSDPFIPVNYVQLSDGSTSEHYIYAYDPYARKAEATVTNVQFGKDYIQQSGSDHLVGSWWNETINGQSGDDALFGGDGDDTINGGAGDDWLFGGGDNDIVDGGDDDDIIFGGDGNDELIGGSGDDAIFGGDGDDYIDGGDGADWIDAGDGADLIIGGAGDDIIYAGGGDDDAYGGEGMDVIYGQGGNDTLYGNEGIDWLYGESGNDKLYGVEDEDHLYGGVGDDVIDGNAGNDFIYGGAGYDYISGGEGADVIDGGDGLSDAVRYQDSTAGVNVNLTTGLGFGGEAEGDVITNIERIYGSAFDDVLTGDAGDNRLYANSGNDILNGEAGNDLLYGHYTGADILNGGDGIDTMYGGLDGDILNGGDGDDRISYYYISSGVNIDMVNGTVDGITGTWVQDIFTSIERVYASNGGDIITGNSDNNRIYTYAGDDLVNTGAGHDTIYSHYAGASIINSGDDDDFIYSNLTGNNIDGGDGFDRLSYWYSSVAVIVNMVTGVASNNNGDQDTFSNIEQIYASNHGDQITGDDQDSRFYGYDGDDIINAGGGIDKLHGQDGNDSLYGGAGDDLIYSGNGSDYIFGEDGDDLIYGDLGNDVIDGGAGEDTVSYYSSTDNLTIDLSNNIANGSSIGLDFITNVERVLGGEGDDDIIGSDGADIIDGYIGNDEIEGGSGNDIIYGGAGSNVLNGGSGDDQITGGSGYDYISGGEGADVIDGGDGLSDAARYQDSTAGVNVNLTTGLGFGGEAEGDIITNIERIYGSAYDDVLTGDAGDNRLYANSGADILNGGAGNDLLYAHYAGADILNGGAGDDTLYGGLDGDTLNGDDGDDRISYYYTSGGVNIDMVNGTVDGIAGTWTQDTFTSIERVYASDDGDIITGNSDNNRIYTYAGDDLVNSGAGHDTIYSHYAGSNTINSGDDNDLIYSNLTGNNIDGGNGIDRLSYHYSSVAVDIDMTTGIASNNNGDQDAFTNIESVYGSGHDDVIQGDSLSNVIYGLDGDDEIRGGGGDDTIYGAEGNDIINGEAGRDYLFGDIGNDIFVFSDLTHSTGVEQDRIEDFEQGNDLIDLSAFTFTSISDLTITQDTLNTYFADAGSDFIFRVDGLHSLNDNDFIFS
ncbi:calcium-binding protein [Phaeodactylibacter sp.]|uniref:calcium-binding protein n=1 Tax=Phaeodactylibacter sp. TaxID=1940289 RepID=UPI0025DD271C|nr:calcium-binding protein [Phaeodactylibacter sp.]